MAERKYHRKIFLKNRKLSFAVKFLGGSFLFFAFCFLILFAYYAKDLPRPEKFSERNLSESSKIYDRTGQILLYEIYGEEKRTWVPLGGIPEILKQAVIATEDANFYHHFGVDFRGIARAILADLKIGGPAYGGSTIPQQLIRSTFLSSQKTAERKTREIILSLELDRRYPKDQILEWYLNQIPFGRNAYGVEAASRAYFQKSVSEISLPEAAALAALIKAPSFYSDKENQSEFLNRKNYVLDRMATERFLDQGQAEIAKKEEINFSEITQSIKAPHFTLWIKQSLEKQYGEDFLRERGLKIYTSLNWDFQQLAETVVKEGVEINKTYNANNASLAAIDPKNGEVLAMVGSADYFGEPYPEGCVAGVNCSFDPKFNIATGIEKNPGRQPGSSFKPFIYATAFEKGFDDKTIVVDEMTNFGPWGDKKEYIPQNYDGMFRGPVTLRQALSQSLNVPAVKVLLYLADSPEKFRTFGEEPDSIKTAKELGITTLTPPYGPAIVLGGWEVKLLDMVSAYGVFAADGLKTDLSPILKIEDQKGNVIFENKKDQKRVLESKAARLINSILSDNEARAPMFGWQSHLYFTGYQVAAKTGTTDNFRDCWTIGYTPSISVGVWAGNNNNESMIKKQPAATVAGPIFHKFMEGVLSKLTKETFPPLEIPR